MVAPFSRCCPGASTTPATERPKGDDSARSQEQIRVVDRLLTAGHGVDAVVGVAAAGKSTLMDACRIAWDATGTTYAGACLSAIGAQGLQDASAIPPRTVASWLQRIETGPGLIGIDVLVLDEPAMTDDRSAAPLLTEAARGLLERDVRPTTFGCMHRVRLTRVGRAAARAGTANTPGGPRKAALGERSWQVLALLWKADARGEILPWGHSPTIENVLIKKHVPPLAESVSPGSGYRITDRGKNFYREQYAAHAAAHPDVTAPHPDGARAEPWPAEASARLARLARARRALAVAWKEARDQHQAAQAEA
ncbi:AAA family ATPase [Streptomyces omiyaensis]|uniref:AAA family ATPase n=1 Tax=Streptomyces omiyaensis TaxID=68247 RepID=UPI0036FA9C73